MKFNLKNLFSKKKVDIPIAYKKESRTIIEPHIVKRTDRNGITSPYGGYLSIMDNLSASIKIIGSNFKLEEEGKRRIEEVKKNITMDKRQFTILLGDKLAEETFQKELTDEEELRCVYAVFDKLEKFNKDIYFKEWSFNAKQTVDNSFRALMEITYDGKIPAQPLLVNSMYPEVKINPVPFLKQQKPEEEDDGDQGPGFDGGFVSD